MNKMRKILRKLLLVICGAGMIGSGSMLISGIWESRYNTLLTESLAIVADNDEMKGTAVEEVSADLLWNKRKESYKLLKEVNPDLAGWIAIPDTRINYPVMQSPITPDYYIDHNFIRESSRFGVPYIAGPHDTDRGLQNIVIYGHHMKDGTMFADLLNYSEESYYLSHPHIKFDTLSESGDFQILGVMMIPAVEQESEFYTCMQAVDEEQFNLFIRIINSRSLYETGVTVQYGDKLLTLITCEYSRKNGRMIVVSKKSGADPMIATDEMERVKDK